MEFTCIKSKNVKCIYPTIAAKFARGGGGGDYKEICRKTFFYSEKYCIFESIWYNVWYHRKNVYLCDFASFKRKKLDGGLVQRFVLVVLG